MPSRAGAVVVDPNNGNILAMATVPSFDPNTFIPSIKAKDWKALQKDEGDPLVNRAISCLPPGSTFKLITSLAGLRGTKNLANARYNCSGGVSYGDHYFQCWGRKHSGHGTVGLVDAIKVSCDSFFYQYGNAAGIQSIDHIGKMLGIGEESGLQLSRRTDWQYARAGVDADSPSAGKMVTSPNGKRYDWAGLYTCFATPTRNGIRCDRKWRRVLLPPLG